MRIELIHPKELSERDCAQWRAHQGADPSVASPFLTPDWAKTVATARKDARVAVIENGRGYLGVQRVNGSAAMGLGAPISDYQGVVGETGLAINPGKLCRAVKVGRIDLAHVPVGQTVLPRPAGTDGSWIVDVSGGVEAYRAGQLHVRKEFIRQNEKKLRKLERERGKAAFTALSSDSAHFETMLIWKLQQLARSGQPPIWGKPWVRAVLDQTFAAREPHFGGALFTLEVGGRLAAANYFLRTERVLHDWIIAHDAEFEIYSPGVLLANWAIEWAASNGFAEVDFGTGEYRYKRQFSTGQRMLGWGAVSSFSVSSAVRQTEFALRAGFERVPNKRLAALPGKAMRRLDLMRGLAHGL